MEREILHFKIEDSQLQLSEDRWATAGEGVTYSVSRGTFVVMSKPGALWPRLANPIGRYISLKEGRRYRLSFEALSTNVQFKASVVIADMTGDNRIATYLYDSSTNFTKQVFEFIAPIDSNRATAIQFYVNEHESSIGNAFQLTNILFEELLAEELVDNPITEYKFTSNLMGLPSLTATIKAGRCLDKAWTLKEYVELRGEKYYLKETPDSSKENTDARYSHDLTFSSERSILDGLYFLDIVSAQISSTADKPATNSSEFSFYGTLAEFADRMNSALSVAGVGNSYLKEKTTLTPLDKAELDKYDDGYAVIVDPSGGHDLTVNKEMTFSDQTLLEAITEGYNTYEVPFVFEGRKIIFGREPNIVEHVFEYGVENSLLSVTKNNANVQPINLITFKGSNENIPYYYPNETEYGHIVTSTASSNKVVTSDKISIIDMHTLLSNTRANKNIIYRHRSAQFGGDVQLNGASFVYDKDGGEMPETPLVLGGWNNLPEDSDGYITLYFGLIVKSSAPVTIDALKMSVWLLDRAQPTEDYNILTTGNISKRSMSIHHTTSSLFTVEPVTVKPTGEVVFPEIPAGSYVLKVQIALGQETTNCYWRVGDVSFTTFTKINYFWECDGIERGHLSDFGLKFDGELTQNAVGDIIRWKGVDRMPFQTNLMAPIYRRTNALERFYKATNDPENEAYVDVDGVRHAEAYLDPDTNQYYLFGTPYSTRNPKAYIYVNEDIKPTIEGIKNTKGQLFGSILDVAFDKDDNDFTALGEDNENYEHSYFYIKLPIYDGEYGFNLFQHASQTDAMTLQMTSGACAGCKFKIQVVEGTEWLNPVQTNGPDGDILFGNYSDKVNKNNIQEWQQNTQTHSIWICVQKDTDTFGVIMPNHTNQYYPKAGDEFNIINIDLPQPYIAAAEKRGEEDMMRYMADHNSEFFNFDIKCSRIFFTEHPEVLAQLGEYSKIKVRYDGFVYDLYITSMTINCKDNEALPEIELSISDEISTSQSFATTVANRALTLIANVTTLGGAPVTPSGGINLSIADQRYLNKNRNDRSEFGISSNTFFEIGRYLAGASGGMFGIDAATGKSFLEVDDLHVRMKAVFQTLEIAHTESIGGEQIITPGGSVTIDFVEVLDNGNFKCFYKGREDEKGAQCRFQAGDFVRCQEFNVSRGTTQDAENKSYWRKVVFVSSMEPYFVLSATDCLPGSDIPAEGDIVTHLGGSATARQSAIVLSTTARNAPSITLYNNIDDFTLNGKEIVSFGVQNATPFFNVGTSAAYLHYNTRDGMELLGKLNVKSTIDGTTLEDIVATTDSLGYLKKALAQDTSIEGGLILTSLISLGEGSADNRTTYSGINGTIDPAKKDKSIALWYGGDMLDMEDFYNWDDDSRKWVQKDPTANLENIRIAKGLDRMDGSGYRAGGNLWWDVNGTIHADPMSFIVGENYVGVNLALFAINPNNADHIDNVNYVTPNAPFSRLDLGTATHGRITWDEQRQMFCFSHGIYSYGDITAFEDGSSGGGGNELVAASAVKLTTPRKIWGQPFDGTADITGPLSGVTSISMTGGIYAPFGDFQEFRLKIIGATDYVLLCKNPTNPQVDFAYVDEDGNRTRANIYCGGIGATDVITAWAGVTMPNTERYRWWSGAYIAYDEANDRIITNKDIVKV